MTSVSSASVSWPDLAAQAAHVAAAEAPDRDDDAAFPHASFAALREMGLLRAALPPEVGGAGLSGAALLRVLRIVGRSSLPVGRVFEGHVNALQLIARYGAPQQVRRAAQDAAAGHLYGVWNTEEPPGVRLTFGPGHAGVLSGAKLFASGAGAVTRPLVPAETSAGRVLVLLGEGQYGERTPGSWKPLGMRASVSERLDFSGVKVEESDIIGAPGDYYRQPDFSAGALRFLAVQLGGADTLLSAVQHFLLGIGRQADPVQVLRFGAVAAALEGASLSVQRAEAWRASLDQAGTEPFLVYVSLARGLVEDACLALLEAAERAVGARGLLAPQPFSRLTRDLRTYLRQPAPDAARLQLGEYVLRAPLPGAAWDAWSPA